MPLLDWTTFRLSYVANYDWLGASLIARNLGNTLSNGQQRNVTGEFDFSKLYSKSRLLRSFEEDMPAAPAAPADTTGGPKADNGPRQMPGVLKFAGRLLTSLKRVSVTYSEVSASTLYGYTDSTRILGMNFKTMAPGLDYVF